MGYSHEPHDRMPNYDERQVLVDGCPECERRGSRPELALEQMDPTNFRKAWQRAADWNSTSIAAQRAAVGIISSAEAPTLRLLWLVQVQMQRSGWKVL